MRFENKRLQLNLPAALLLLSLYALALAVAAMALATEPLSVTYACIRENPVILLWNFLPALFITLAVFFITGLFPASVVTGTLIVLTAAIANHYKIHFRDDPFLPSDFTQLREALAFAGVVTGTLTKRVVIMAGAFAAASAASFFVRVHTVRWQVRAAGLLGIVLLAAMLNQWIYADRVRYLGYYHHRSIYKQTDIYNSRGFLYSFWHYANNNRIEKPEGYSKKQAEQILEAYGNEQPDSVQPAAPVNVVFIMSEAFSELSGSDYFDFTGHTDPLAHYNRLKDGSLYGGLAVPDFGGGTANTEFDVLTGLYTRFIGESPSSFWYIRKPFESIVSVFKDNHYEAVALHPGADWFYNRKSVYAHLGFDRFISLKDFEQAGAQYKGTHISDASAYTMLKDVITEEREHPLFAYMVTIQNHTPYAHKFEANAEVFQLSPDFPGTLTSEETDLLSNYFIGVHDGDTELKQLTDFLRAYPEPYALVFYGDHLPSLGAASRVYDLLGYDDAARRQTGYLIWLNNAAKAQVSLSDLSLPPGETVSAPYLGGAVLELLLPKQLPPFFNYLNAQRKEIPVISRDMDTTGIEERLRDYRAVEYYRLTQ